MRKVLPFLPLVVAILFPVLFFRQQAGINVLLMNVVFAGLLFVSGRFNPSARLQLLLLAGALLTSLMVVMYGSMMAVAANWITLVLLLGATAGQQLALLPNAIPAAVFAILSGPVGYFKSITDAGRMGVNGRRILRFILAGVIPVVILLFFTALYAASSPFFNKLTGNLLEHIQQFIEIVTKYISPEAFWIGFWGMIFGFAFNYGMWNKRLRVFNENASNQLQRLRNLLPGSLSAFRTKYLAGVVLLILLNGVLAVMNGLDIVNVWLNFEWNGLYLKQFVHEGTWLLIFSIVVSMGIALYFFSGNISFYSKNKRLKQLATAWLLQNALLAVSVGVRNMWYIWYFNLAYKRIGVYAFLLLTLTGIVTVLIKIHKRKNLRYLLYYNSIAAWAIVVSLSLFNWDKTIAAYNLAHYKTAFYHTDFMVTLNSSALPELQKAAAISGQIGEMQQKQFSFTRIYMSPHDFESRISERVKNFKQGYPLMGFMGWNYADYAAYRALSEPLQTGSAAE